MKNDSAQSMSEIMNTKERRAAPTPTLEMTLIQPWSIPVMKMKLPSDILSSMITLTDQILEDEPQRAGQDLMGQIENEYYVVSPDGTNKLIEFDAANRTELMRFFLSKVYEFLYTCKSQLFPMVDLAELKKEEWLTQMRTMWFNSQQPGEYNPTHAHSNCQISAVMYLKVPEMIISKKAHRPSDDGSIVFHSNWSGNYELSTPSITLAPEVGDFYIFGAQQQHLVYPFRCAEGQEDVERRSVSFNAVYKSKQQASPVWDRVSPDKPPIMGTMMGGVTVDNDPRKTGEIHTALPHNYDYE